YRAFPIVFKMSEPVGRLDEYRTAAGLGPGQIDPIGSLQIADALAHAYPVASGGRMPLSLAGRREAPRASAIEVRVQPSGLAREHRVWRLESTLVRGPRFGTGNISGEVRVFIE